MVFIKILIFLVAVAACIAILKYTEKIVRVVGKNSWAEKYLGGGGTYTMWKIIAIVIVAAALWYLLS